jgi:hypothetical protein
VSPFFNVNVGPHVAFCETAMMVGDGDAELVSGKTLAARRAAPLAIKTTIAPFSRRRFDEPRNVDNLLMALSTST